MNIIETLNEIGGITYDYTKIIRRQSLPNYDLTFSMHETNRENIRQKLRNGEKVAVVFNIGHHSNRKNELPTKFMRFPVFPGDDSDLRFLDRKLANRHNGGLVIGLRAKGDALSDTSGFVVHRGDKDILSREQHILHNPYHSYISLEGLKNKIVVDNDTIQAYIEKAMDSIHYKLFSKPDSNPKTNKSVKLGYLTLILHLAPSTESRIVNLCPMASKGCAAACLYHAGAVHLLVNKVRGRIVKTHLWANHRNWFIKKLVKETETWYNYAKKRGLKLAIRLNGTSDIQWEKIKI